jgi:cyclophilin family peptidyl-prolyl cis-trans isomerase
MSDAIFLIRFDLFSFGYVVEGADFLQDIKEGDVIVSAKVTKGLEYLKQPA